MRIALLYASAGEGHKKVAEAIKEAFLSLGVAEKEILLLDVLDDAPRPFRVLYHSIYYYSVKYLPRLWGFIYETSDHSLIYKTFVQRLRRFVNGFLMKRLIQRILREKPQAIISTHFLAPEIFGYLKLRRRISSFLLTVITDYMPHTFWVNQGTDHYWVMSHECKEELESRGVPSQKITAGGIPVGLHFRNESKKAEFRRKEGLDPDRFTILITSGGFGFGPAGAVLEALIPFKDRLQAIVVTGKNRRTYRLLHKKKYPFPVVLYGFVSHMHELMEAGDVIIAKPGGATTTESLAKGVPMIVLKPIPGQEGRNANLLKKRNASFFIHSAKDLPVVLKAILDYPEVLDEKKEAMSHLSKPEAALSLARFVLERITVKTS